MIVVEPTSSVRVTHKGPDVFFASLKKKKKKDRKIVIVLGF